MDISCRVSVMLATGYSVHDGRKSAVEMMQTEKDERVYRFSDDDAATKEALRDYYDRFYGESEFQYYDERTTEKFLGSLLRKAGARPGGTVLDVGCATGYYTECLRRIGMKSVGIDLSQVGILKGHAKYPGTLLSVGDGSNVPYKENAFDIIYMLGCSLTNTRNTDAISSYLTYLTRFLTEDGVLIFLGGSDFSGGTAGKSEWIYHGYHDILRFVDHQRVDADGPYITNLKLISKLGGVALTTAFSMIARKLPGRRTWTIVYFIRKKKS